MAKYRAFKESYGKTVDRLSCTVKASSHFDTKRNGDFIGIWDTGAQVSAVSPTVAEKLNLSPVDSWEVYGVNGKTLLPVILVDLKLPNNHRLESVYAVVADIGGGDILLGMNAITQGDFLITNKNCQTELTFVVPPLEDRPDLYRTAIEINHSNSF
ncbi:MAG: retroviral-like aspartic protease family protein [Treponema sp.]|nr:retroviral-like aspartic protease family protein [Treponema sp.]